MPVGKGYPKGHPKYKTHLKKMSEEGPPKNKKEEEEEEGDDDFDIAESVPSL